MAHELTLDVNGKAEMAFIGDRADIWHGLGNQLQEGASIEEWRNGAGMAWNINRAPATFFTGEENLITGMPEMGSFPDKHILFRSDNKKPLGIVSDNYKIVQPGEVLEFFRDLVAGNGFSLHTAGTLFGGKRMWALASIGEKACIVGNQDAVGGYLLLSTSCDGTLATEARFTTVRVVCNNTLSMAKSEKDAQIVRISHKSAFNPKAMHDKLGIATDSFAQFMLASRSLASVKVDNVKAREFVEGLIMVPDVAYEDQSTQAKNKCDFIMSLFNGKAMGSDLESSKGTMWGALNAVTEYVDHHTRANTVDARLNSALFEKGSELKSEAFAKALEMV